jgi:hypothetical protein
MHKMRSGKKIEEFSWSIRGIKRHSRCRTCRNEERMERYERNKAAELAYKSDRQVRKREEVRVFVEEYKRNHPCMDCGNTDTMVLSFDHVRGKKKMDISQMVNQGYSLEAIRTEYDLGFPAQGVDCGLNPCSAIFSRKLVRITDCVVIHAIFRGRLLLW